MNNINLEKIIILTLIFFLNTKVFAFNSQERNISIPEIEAVYKPKMIDYAGIYRISTSQFVIIYHKTEGLSAKWFINSDDTDMGVNYLPEDGSIIIQNKRYQLAICTKTIPGKLKRGTLGLVNDTKKFFKIDHRGFFELRYPEASFLKFIESDIESYSPYDLKLMRNQIFARHGYIFEKASKMDAYFSNKNWYNNIKTKTKNVELNEIEQHNVNLISAFEGRKKEMARVLLDKETEIIFKAPLKRSLKIDFPIRRVYYCKDTLGEYYLILTENEHAENNQEPFNDAIKAFYVKKEEDNYILLWKMQDFLEDDESGESSIWFWTRYFDIKDIDGDGQIDPVILYGTENYYGAERVKILVYYKGKKLLYAITEVI